MAVLSDEEFDDRADYGRGTLGDVLVTLLRIYFPGRDITSCETTTACTQPKSMRNCSLLHGGNQLETSDHLSQASTRCCRIPAG